MKINKLSVLIPVFNEEATVYQLLKRIIETKMPHNIGKEIIIVDDGSTDESVTRIESFIKDYPNQNIQLHQNLKNSGKGAAVQTAIKFATGEYCIVQDADLEYDPAEYVFLLEPVIRGSADVVYGSRFMGGNPHRILFFWHSIGNKFLTFLSNVVTNLNLTDMSTCYKLFNTKLLQSIDLFEPGFGFDTEVTTKISRIKNVRIYEVGISYFGRTYQEGKKINWQDGIRVIYCIAKYGLFRQ